MDCSCRTTALRIFVKSIAQIHLPLRPAPPRLAQSQAIFNRPSQFRNPRTLAAAPSRAIHTTCVDKSPTETTYAVEDHDGGWTKEEPSTDTISREPTPASNLAVSPQSRLHAEDTDAPVSVLRKVDAGNQLDMWDKRERRANKERKKGSKFGLRDKEDDGPPPKKEPWMIQKAALKEKFPEGWNPRKKLSPDALVGIKALHKQFPEEYTTEVLAAKFEVSPEAIRRILRAKWTPSPEDELKRQERWFNRGKQVWANWAAVGKKPPRRWREEGIVRDPYWNRPRGPTHKDKEERAEAQRQLAKNLLG